MTYLSNRVRILRGNKGTTFILRKEEYFFCECFLLFVWIGLIYIVDINKHMLD